MSEGYFVTGTDTGIGKTVVSTILAVGLHGHYWKPIQTGASDATDSDFVRQWLPEKHVWPEAYCFSDPVSPHLAAQRVKSEINLREILTQKPSVEHSLIIEGAGGVLVPINRENLMIDLIARLSIPVIVVSSTRLGTINHTLLTLKALQSRAIRICGVVTVGPINRANEEAITHYGRVAILGRVSPCHGFSKEWFHESFRSFSNEVFQCRRQPCPIA